jgi:peptidylprolyl isomerase
VRRSVPLVVLAAASALLLTACAGGGDSKAKSTPKATTSAAASLGCDLKEGAASKAVKLTGDVGTAPTLSVPSGTKATTEQRTIVKKGTGETPKAGRWVVGGLAAYDATTGKAIGDPFGWGDQQGRLTVLIGNPQMVPGLTQAFGCVPIGSRVVYAAPAAKAFGSADNVSQNFSDGSVKATDSVVFVADVLSSIPNKADGAEQAATAGFPTVKTAADGTPTVTIPKGAAAPTSTQVETLKKGTGPTVNAGDEVIVQYQGTEWKSGKIFDQSWGTAHEKQGQAPAANSASQFATTDVVKGFSDALVGQTVGSQVVVVMTPADGYGDNPPQGQSIITKTSNLVFVVDILQAASTQ